MDPLKPTHPPETADRSESQEPGQREDGKGSLDLTMEVLEQELERAQQELRQGDEESTCVVGPPPPLLARSESLTRGTEVGRYRVMERLGSGGMGEVYAAFDPQLNRRVALKLLLPGGEDTDARQARPRLMHEAQAMARLSHPHVLPVFDIGEHGERVFIALELVEGSTLRQWLKEAARPWRQVVDVLTQAGQGLAAAHAAGLVHRDFKPDNVLVGRDGRVLVYDFGLACELGTGSPRAPVPVDLNALLSAELSAEPSGSEGGFTGSAEDGSLSGITTREPLETPVTRAGLIMGTPGYMAPEQYRHEPLTGQADQFSFCATLYYALYGEHAFEGGGAGPLARATLEGRLRAPPRDSDVPGWVRQVVLRGLSPRPEQRYASMADLLVALHDEPRMRRWRQVLVAVALAFLGAVVTGAVSQWHQEQSVCQEVVSRMDEVWDAPRQEAVQRAFLATGQPYAADTWAGVKSALDAYASTWLGQQRQACEATRLRGDASEERLAVRTACLERRRAEFRALTGLLAEADAPMVESAVEAVRGLSELSSCDPPQALPEHAPAPRDEVKAARVDEGHAQLARARALRLSGRYSAGLSVATALASAARAQDYAPLKAEALLELGRQQLAVGDPLAEHSLREAAWTADEVGLDEVRAEALVSLTQLLAYDAARAPDGHEAYQQAHALLVRTRREGRLVAELESAHGLLYSAQGDPVAAESSQRNALGELERAALGETPEGAMVLRRLGLVLSAQGRHEEALIEDLRAHEIYLRALGAEHPRVGITLVSIGASLSALGRHPEALTALRQGVDLVTRTLPPHHPFQAMALDALGQALWSAGEGEEARRVLRQAVEAAERARGPGHLDAAQPCATLGAVLVDQRPGEALSLFTRALRLREQSLGSHHPELAAPLTGQGEALLKLGRPAEALAPLERALTLRATHTVPPEALATTRFTLARALWDKDPTRARLLARQAGEALVQPGTEPLRARITAWLAERAP